MARLIYNNMSGLLGAALTSGGGTITFAAAPTYDAGIALPTLTGGNIIALTLEGGTTNFEVVWLTVFNSSTPLTGTITRGQEGTSPLPHLNSVNWSHNPTTVDFTSVGFANPMSTPGDLIVGGATGTAGRLGIGADGKVLTIDPTTHLPAWDASVAGFTNPMNTLGDIITGGGSGVAGRLGIGSAAQVLTVSSGVPAWAAASASPGSLVDNGSQVYNVKNAAYGAKGDEVDLGDVNITVGTNIATSASAAFVTGDVGKLLNIYGANDRIGTAAACSGSGTTLTDTSVNFCASDIGLTVTATGGTISIPGSTTITSVLGGGGNSATVTNTVTGSGGTLTIHGGGVLQAAILARTNATTVTLQTPALTSTVLNAVRTVTNGNAQFGHDDTVAIQGALNTVMALLPATPSTAIVFIPTGRYLVQNLNPYLTGVTFTSGTLDIRGAGMDNTVLVASGSSLLGGGSTPGGATTGCIFYGSLNHTPPPRLSIQDMTLDGSYNLVGVGGMYGYRALGAILSNIKKPYQSDGPNWSILNGTGTVSNTATSVVIANITGFTASATSSLGLTSSGMSSGAYVGMSVNLGTSTLVINTNTGTNISGSWVGGTPAPGAFTIIPLSGSPNIIGALISIDQQISSSTQQIGYGTIYSVTNDGTNDTVTLTGNWVGTYSSVAYTPATHSGAQQWYVDRGCYRGKIHYCRMVRFYRSFGYATFPSSYDFDGCIFEDDGAGARDASGNLLEPFHGDNLGGGGDTAVVRFCTYIRGAGNLADFAAGKGQFAHITFIGNRVFSTTARPLSVGGPGSVIMGNDFSQNTGGAIGYGDNALANYACGSTTVMGNHMGMMTISTPANPGPGSYNRALTQAQGDVVWPNNPNQMSPPAGATITTVAGVVTLLQAYGMLT